MSQIAEQVLTETGKRVAAGGNIFERSIVLSVEIGALGVARRVGGANVKTKRAVDSDGISAPVVIDSDTNMVRVNKSLLESSELTTIRSLHGEIRTYLYGQTVKGPLRAGMYITPLISVGPVDRKLVEYQAQLCTLVDAFIDAYPSLIEEARGKLGPLFDATEYPDEEAVRRAFYLTWEWISFGVPASLQQVQDEIYNRELEKAQRKMSEAADMVQTALRAELLELVNHARERLSGTTSNGKPKVFRDTLIGNIRGFFETFDARNLTGDEALQNIVDRAKGLLDGVDAGALRDSDQARAQVAAGFAEIQATLDGMIVDKPVRLIDLD